MYNLKTLILFYFKRNSVVSKLMIKYKLIKCQQYPIHTSNLVIKFKTLSGTFITRVFRIIDGIQTQSPHIYKNNTIVKR